MKFRVDSVSRREGARQIEGKGAPGEVLQVGITPQLDGPADSSVAGTLHLSVPVGAPSPFEEGKVYKLGWTEVKPDVKSEAKPEAKGK